MTSQQSLHPDSQTTLPDTDYFLFGSGKVTAAIQWSRNRSATPLGIILQEPEHFTRKWGSYLFHPEFGLERTMVSVIIDGVAYRPTHEDMIVSWSEHEGVSNVLATWHAGGHNVIESFYAAPGSNSIIRWICVRGGAGHDVTIEAALYANPTIFSSFGSQPGWLYASGMNAVRLASKQTPSFNERFMQVKASPCFGSDVEAHLTYTIGEVTPLDIGATWESESAYWNAATRIHSSADSRSNIIALFGAASRGLRAAVAANGRFDASIWQYGMEWGRDASRIAEGLVYSGQFDLAKAVLTNILEHLSNDEGQVAEASRFRGGMNSELDSNGFVLGTIKTYFDWTGDSEFIILHLPRIAAIADHLLRPEFLDVETGMLKSARDTWERMEAMGIEPGYDVAHQCVCMHGLEAIATVATALGHDGMATRWSSTAARIKDSFVRHATHCFIEDGRIIKRRRLDGSIQRTLNVDRRKESSDYFSKFVPTEMPLSSEAEHLLEPDVTQLFPILLGIVDANSEVATATLQHVDTLWSQAWEGGGIGRYDVSGEPDSPGPWSLATIFYAQAALKCGDMGTFEKSVEWLAKKAGAGGSWFEFYGERPTPPLPPIGVLPWSWAEFVILVVRDVLGATVSGGELTVEPLMSGFDARIRFHNAHVECKS